MNPLLDMLLGQQNNSNLKDIMNQLGLDETQARDAIGSLLPQITQGIQKQASQQNISILDQIAKGQQQRYLEDDSAHLYDDDAIQGGNDILGQIFGSKQVSREVAGQAAQQTGIDSSILKKLLPMVASMAMGAMGKQASGSGLGSNPAALLEMVSSMMGGDNSASGRAGGLGGLMGAVGKLLGR